MSVDWRMMLISAGVLAMLCPAGEAVGQDASKQLVIVSWGGSYQAAQRKAFFEPFEKETGIRIVEGTGPQLERSRAEVQSGRPSFDMTATNQAFYSIGVGQNLWEPIDYKYFRDEDLKALSEDVRLKFGVGSIYYAEGMAISTAAFPDGKKQPGSWVDFWDTQAFPGKRTLPYCDVATFPLPEAALLADGVAIENLYPIDIPRAVRKVRALADHVVWWKDVNQPGQYLASGEVVMALAPSGRIQQLIDKAAPIKIVWNQQRHTFDPWYVLRGASGKDNAMKFIAFASRPENQAEMARLSGNAPTNSKALDLLAPELARVMPTWPENFKKGFRKGEKWWVEHRAAWVEACTAGLLSK